MPTYIQNLLNGALGDGARATKFDCDIIFSNAQLFPDKDTMRTLVKSTNMPGKNHDIIDFKYKGRSIPLKGQVKYNQSWECTFYLTEDHKLKNAFEVWLEALDQKHNYINDTSAIAGLDATQAAHGNAIAIDYTSTVHLFQRNFDNSQITAQYYLRNVFPIAISDVTYSADAVGQVQEFTVTFAYSYYEMNVVKGKDGNFVDQFVDKAEALIQSGVDGILDVVGGFAADAIGAGAKQVESLFTNPSGFFSSASETAVQVSKQIAHTADDMFDSIFNTRNK